MDWPRGQCLKFFFIIAFTREVERVYTLAQRVQRQDGWIGPKAIHASTKVAKRVYGLALRPMLEIFFIRIMDRLAQGPISEIYNRSVCNRKVEESKDRMNGLAQGMCVYIRIGLKANARNLFYKKHGWIGPEANPQNIQ